MFPTISLYLHQPSDQLSTVLYHQGWRDPITLRGIPGTHSTLSIRPTVKAHSVNLRKRGSCTVQIMLVSPTHPSPSPELSGPESKCVTQQQWKLYCKCLHNYWIKEMDIRTLDSSSQYLNDYNATGSLSSQKRYLMPDEDPLPSHYSHYTYIT